MSGFHCYVKKGCNEMSKIPIVGLNGGVLGEFEVDDKLLVFSRGGQAVHDVVTAFRAGLRAGTASTLNKGLVSGSNRKPWKQKGLGRARAGYRQSPIWRGGGVVFGPKPRSYAKTVPKGILSLAFRRVLSDKFAAGAVKVLNELALKEGKTKQIIAITKELKVKGKALFVIEKPDENLKRAARNTSEVAIALASDINVYQLLLYPNLLVTKEAMTVLVNRLKKATGC